MRTYTQLTENQRYQIQSFMLAGYNYSEIAVELNVHRSTIAREVKRNRSHKGYYHARDAHEACLLRHLFKRKAEKMTGKTVRLTRDYLKLDLSPEQISAVLNDYHGIKLSHETIYRFVIADKVAGGSLFQHLRHRFKKNKKRYGSQDGRGHIKDRVMIDERPEIVNRKSRIGDWEIDTVIGKNHQGALITIVERKTNFTLIRHISKRTASLVALHVIDMLKPCREFVRTITSDNGKEFSLHKKIAKALKCDIYFAHPYSSWERGLNENTNGLIRQYFPKGSDFSGITTRQIKRVMDRLNNRPRKLLGWYTPNELFMGIPFKPVRT